jgi:hypothetical protein
MEHNENEVAGGINIIMASTYSVVLVLSLADHILGHLD